MRHPAFLSAITFTAALTAGTAAAQPLPSPPREQPPAEISLGAGAITIIDLDYIQHGSFGPTADVRVTLPVNARFALEGGVMLTRESSPTQVRTWGLYSLVVKQRMVRASTERRGVFLTYGAAGNFAHVSSPRFGSYNELDPPFISTLGVTVQQTVARHLVIRTDAQFMTVLWLPLGPRVSAGVSIPFGVY